MDVVVSKCVPPSDDLGLSPWFVCAVDVVSTALEGSVMHPRDDGCGVQSCGWVLRPREQVMWLYHVDENDTVASQVLE